MVAGLSLIPNDGARLHVAGDCALGVLGNSLAEEGRRLVGWDGALDPTERCPDSLKGMAAVVVLDPRERSALLACDRLGIRTLYFFASPDALIFASTVKSLVAHPAVPKTIDPQSIYNYVYFHVAPSPRGIYAGVQRLEPGELVRSRNGTIERRRYWQPSFGEGARAEEELIGEFRAEMRAAVANTLARAEGKVGAFLSGGTDSSTVAGWVGEITGEPANTYSIGFEIEGFDESRYARIAVEHFGTRHHDYIVTPGDLADAIPRLAQAYDEPFGNASAVASYYCARLAKDDGVTTMLGGDGGDELFGGNERYAKQKLFDLYLRLPGALRSLVGVIPYHKARSYVRQAKTPLPDRLEEYNFIHRMTPEAIFAPDFLGSVRTDEPLELLRKTYSDAPASSTLNRLLYLDWEFTLADNDLRKVGRTCEMAGVGVLYPFLEPELVDFANRIPPELKLKGRKLRYFFKRASEGFLPREILEKQKHGFGVPCGRWMRDHEPLRELAYDSLSSLVRRGYLRDDFANRLRTLHQGEHTDYYGVMVWVLTMLELWHQNHADR
jgi:asparagine synthase (glutamine-hydrolysing)